MHQKNQFRVQWGGSGAFVVKNSNTTLWHELLHYFGPFIVPCLIRQPNGPKCTQIVRNAEKCQFRVQGVDRVRLLRKIPTRLRGTNFCNSWARFAPSFVRQPNGPECTQIVRKTHQNVSLGSNGLDRVRSLWKIPTRLRGTNFCKKRSARFP